MAWQHPSVYPRGRSCIIVGAAPSVLQEYHRARAILPDADVIAVKFAVALIRAREAVVGHLDMAHLVRAVHEATWRTPVRLHGIPTANDQDPPNTGTDVLWEALRDRQGGSGWRAALVAKALGYQRIVLAGVHLSLSSDPDPYHPAVTAAVRAISPHWHEARVTSIRSPFNILRWQGAILADLKAGRAAGITSLGGWTRDMLGEPDLMKEAAHHGRH